MNLLKTKDQQKVKKYGTKMDIIIAITIYPPSFILVEIVNFINMALEIILVKLFIFILFSITFGVMETHFFNSNHSDIVGEVVSFLDINDHQDSVIPFIYFSNDYDFTKKILLIWKKNSNYTYEFIKDKRSTKGEEMWKRNGKLHREGDLPAFVYGENAKKWFKSGKCHREGDLPAIEYFDSQEWWINGKHHRDGDKPAILDFSTEGKEWYKNGKLHRDNDLPAFVFPEVDEWWVNGKIHRDGGLPAIINYCNDRNQEGLKVWYINGVKQSSSE